MKLMHSLVVALLAFLLADGGIVQGQETKKRPGVSGTVTFDGKPLTAGVVVFHPGKGMRDIVMAEIDESGKYVARKLKSGEMKVTIDVDSLEAQQKQLTQRLKDLENRAQLIKSAKKENADLDKQITEMKERVKMIDKVRKNLVKVPKKYTDVETTPLTATIKEDDQTINFELKD